MAKDKKTAKAKKERPQLRVVAIPTGFKMGWMRLETMKRWMLLKYRYVKSDRKCPWRLVLLVESDKEYQELKKFDFRTQVAKVLQCSRRDSGKLLKLVEAELEKLNV